MLQSATMNWKGGDKQVEDEAKSKMKMNIRMHWFLKAIRELRQGHHEPCAVRNSVNTSSFRGKGKLALQDEYFSILQQL